MVDEEPPRTRRLIRTVATVYSELDWRCGGDVVSSESSFMVYNNIEIELFMRSCNCATESALPPLVPRSLTRR